MKGGKRDLVIGQDSHGYMALYRFVARVDTVFVLAIRSQREAEYKRKRRRLRRVARRPDADPMKRSFIAVAAGLVTSVVLPTPPT